MAKTQPLNQEQFMPEVATEAAVIVDGQFNDLDRIQTETKDIHAAWRADAAKRLDVAFSRTILARIDEMYRYEDVAKSETEKSPNIGDVAGSLSDSSDTIVREESVAGLLTFKPRALIRMIEVLSFRGFLKSPGAGRADQGKVVLTMQGTAYLESANPHPTGVLEVLSPKPTALITQIDEERRSREQADLELAAKKAADRAAKAAAKVAEAAAKNGGAK